MSGEKKKKSFSWKNFKRAVCYLAKESPGIFPMTVLLAVLEAVYPYIGIFFSARILTELADPGRSMEHLIFLALTLVGLNFLGKRLRDLCAQVLEVMKYTAMKRIVQSIAVKAWQMDYAMSADTKISETKERMTHWFYYRGIMALSGQLLTMLRALVTIGISMGLVVEFFRARAVGEGKLTAFLNHWGASVLFLAMMALSIAYGIYNSARTQKLYEKLDETEAEPMNRMDRLLEGCFSQYQNGKDIRMFHAQGMVMERLREQVGCIEDAEVRTAVKDCWMMFPSNLFSRLFNLLVYLFVGLKAICRAFDVGNILKYTGMVTQLGDGIETLGDSLQYFIQNFENINTYFDYLDMPNLTAGGTLPVTEEIMEDYEFEFRDVTFTYPGAGNPSLSGVNCRFGKGEKIAVVGRNGSGKTTFIKLLCRLCDPDKGQILLNGVDIRQYRYEEYLRFFSTVFQDFQIFAFRLGENVASESEYDEKKVIKALEDAGFGERLKTLEKGLGTQLFKRFSEDGIELSGGESQKVAIARCLYKDAPYVVLDEPTAALDPVAEADIYQRMNQFIGHKGAIYISHRLSSCHFCDRILVLEEGRVAEEGTHASLLAAGGLYRRLWDAQAKYYT